MVKGDISDLTRKYLVGANAAANETYKPVNYKNLRVKLKEEKLKLHLDRQHLKQFNKIKKQYGRFSNQNVHKEIWLKEDISLKSQLKQISNVISDQINPKTLICENEICNFMNQLQKDLATFEMNTVQPVWEFINDVQAWMFQSNHTNRDEISEVFHDIRRQQNNVVDILKNESQNIESDLDTFRKVLKSWEFKAETITDELLQLKFPDETVLTDLIEQYLVIDHTYDKALNDLRSYYKVPLMKGKYGGWEKEDALLLSHIVSQYPISKYNRNELYMEMLKLSFPKKTEAELKEHLERWELTGLYTEHKRTIKRMHQLALKDLVSMATATCKKLWQEQSTRQKKEKEALAQKEKSAKLLQQLLTCKKEKQKRIDEQNKILARYNEMISHELVNIKRRNDLQRKLEKEKIQAYRSLKESQKNEEEEKLKELKEKNFEMKQRSLKAGRKRVDYRRKLADEREDETKFKVLEKAKAEEKKSGELEETCCYRFCERKRRPSKTFQRHSSQHC